MPNPTTIVFGHEWQTYTLALTLTLVACVAFIVLRAPQGQRGAVFDVCLGGLIGGVLVGRAIHVALWWGYFEQNTNQIWQLNDGSIDWHGAFIGAMIGVWLVSRWRKVDLAWLALQVAWLVPLLSMVGWWSCAAGRCAYGETVQFMSDFPIGTTWDAPDIYNVWEPRFAVQPLGYGFSFLVLVLMLAALQQKWLPHWRTGLAIILTGLIGFGLGFLRGDYVPFLGGLRADQWLDLGIIALGIVWIIITIRQDRL